MDKKNILQQIEKLGVLAVIRGPSEELTIKMVEALIKGGMTGIEITYSTPNAEKVVSLLAKEFKDEILLGMGTLTDPEQASRAKTSGAKFLVSPICEPRLVQAMIDSELTTMAGALTPTEIFQAYTQGVDVIKIFPGSLGGPEYVKALKGPFPDILMMPTGGVSEENAADWFKAGVFAVGAGSSLCSAALAREGNFAEITNRAEKFKSVIDSIKNR